MRNIDILCPHCGSLNNWHTHTGGTMSLPSDGDFSICWRCRKVSIYISTTSGLGLRHPTVQELKEAIHDQEVRTALSAMEQAEDPFDVVKRLRRPHAN